MVVAAAAAAARKVSGQTHEAKKKHRTGYAQLSDR